MSADSTRQFGDSGATQQRFVSPFVRCEREIVRYAPQGGEALQRGALRLKSEMVQVGLYRRARAMIEAPAEPQARFTDGSCLSSPTIDAGTASLVRGFRLRIPQLGVVDLKTSTFLTAAPGTSYPAHL